MFFQDRQHIIQRQKITFEVISEYLESIPHTMQWTGDMYANSSLDASSKKKGYELEITEKHTSYCNINIKFPEKKESGFSDTYSFETEVVDSKNKMRPVLARFIKCQTDYLCLKVTVPEGIIKECHSYVSADVPGDLKLSDVKEIIPEKVGQYWCYRFEKKDLELLRYYFLEWKFMNEI